MKEKRNLLIGIALGIIMGWVLGFLRLPFLEKNYSFSVGFMACLALILLIISLLFVWNKNALLLRLIGKNSDPTDSKTPSKTYTAIWTVCSIFLILGGLMLLDRQKDLFEAQTKQLDEKINAQTDLIKSVRNNHLALLISGFLDKIEAELNSNDSDTLSAATIRKIAVLSHSFEPYQSSEKDSLLIHELSLERGLLLMGLFRMTMDSSSFDAIKRSATFSHADLRKADLNGIDLSGADLAKANLWGAKLNGANLNAANLVRADLRWAELNKAALKSANLNGVHLTGATLIQTDLSDATVQWANLDGALLNEANLTNSDLLGASLVKTNLTQTNLSEGRLNNANLSQANLKDSELDKVNVEQNWFEKLDEWQLTGTKAILARYKIADDTSGKHKWYNFRLEKKAQQ